MRVHNTAVNRHNTFNNTNSTFENKVLRLKRLLKNTEDLDKLEITKSNVDSLLNNANRVKLLITDKMRNKSKDKIVTKNLKENITTETEPLVLTNEEILHRKLLDIRNRYDDEIRRHGTHTSLIEGFVYIIFNPSYPDWIKAGMAFDYEKRLTVYNQYDPEAKYSIIALRWTANRRLLESKLLEILTISSSDRKGEWFKINKDISLNIFYSCNE